MENVAPTADLPWRGPGPGRPDLPLPPGPMPLRRDGQLRKRWRYVAGFGERLMICAARAQVGPFTQCFWVVWDRDGGRRLARTTTRPRSREVSLAGPLAKIESRGVSAELRLGEAEPVESICAGRAGWGWTRKRAGMPVAGHVTIEGERIELDGRGVDDESAGYHDRDTSWLWSAGVGTDPDGRELAWNLVEGINDPPQRSERAIWVAGEPREPAPVRFEGLDSVAFADGSELSFYPEAERARDENKIVIRSSYQLRFGRFDGALEGVPLHHGLGVMERHAARW